MEGGVRSPLYNICTHPGAPIIANNQLNYNTLARHYQRSPAFPNQVDHVNACCVLSELLWLSNESKIVMGSSEAVYQFLAFLLFPAIIQLEECHAVSHHARSVNLSVPKTFVESIFDEYGSNNSMNSQQFNSLLEELNIGSSSNEQASENDKAKVWENYVFMIF